MKDRLSVIEKSIDDLRKSVFKVTGFKFEFEANLNRSSHGHTCERSGGCDDCDGGRVECQDCEGSGDWYDEEENCYQTCDNCDGNGNFPCGCNEVGTCSDCEANGGYNWYREQDCHDFLLEKLVPFGLAEPIPGGESYQYAKKFRPTGALVFSKFYNDGSVDSEWTFTIKSSATDVLMRMPEIIEIWKSLAEAMGAEMVVRGAGMHTALLNSRFAQYPSSENQYDEYLRFKQNTQLLLPALYMLAATDDTTRGLNFRRPRIANNDHRSAIDYRNGAIEFRIFDTCYTDPQQILDNFVVIRNIMRYWTTKPIKKPVSGRAIAFGVDNSNTLSRLYQTNDHIEVLNKGLRVIKPEYMTIREVKGKRKFKVTKHTIKKSYKQASLDAGLRYSEYEQRFEWRKELESLQRKYYRRESLTSEEITPETLERIEQDVREWAARYDRENRLSLEQYVADVVRNFEQSIRGEYTLN